MKKGPCHVHCSLMLVSFLGFFSRFFFFFSNLVTRTSLSHHALLPCTDQTIMTFQSTLINDKWQLLGTTRMYMYIDSAYCGPQHRQQNSMPAHRPHSAASSSRLGKEEEVEEKKKKKTRRKKKKRRSRKNEEEEEWRKISEKKRRGRSKEHETENKRIGKGKQGPQRTANVSVNNPRRNKVGVVCIPCILFVASSNTVFFSTSPPSSPSSFNRLLFTGASRRSRWSERRP